MKEKNLKKKNKKKKKQKEKKPRLPPLGSRDPEPPASACHLLDPERGSSDGAGVAAA
jgi:hypothetical protein